MEIKLFALKCKDENCGYTVYTSSKEYKICPSCNNELLYNDDNIAIKTNDILYNDAGPYIENENSILIK